MFIILKEPNSSGAYAPMQTWDDYPIPETHAVWPDDMDTAVFYHYNGFVILTVEDIDGVDIVTDYAPNVDAWEEWKSSLPEPGPEPDPEPDPEPEATVWDELDNAYQEGVNGAYDQ